MMNILFWAIVVPCLIIIICGAWLGFWAWLFRVITGGGEE